jgi:multicomponent Na+:H+ antiporter subunit B
MYTNSLIVRVVSQKMVPFIVMFGAYIIFHGEVSPGGGFQGGVIIGSAFILCALAFDLKEGRKRAGDTLLTIANSLGPSIYALCGLWAVVSGYTFLANKANHLSPHGQIGTLLGGVSLLCINIGIGMTCSSIFTACFFALIEHKDEDLEISEQGAPRPQS